MSLPDPNSQQAGLVSVLVGSGAAWFGLYVNSNSTKYETLEATSTTVKMEDKRDKKKNIEGSRQD
jgi:hypothetical protein